MPRSLGNWRQPNLPFALVKDSLPWRSEAVKPIIAKARKTNDGRWSRSGSTRDLPTIAFFRAGPLLRRNGSTVPDQHDPIDQRGQKQRNITALSHLDEIGKEETRVDAEEHTSDRPARQQA